MSVLKQPFFPLVDGRASEDITYQSAGNKKNNK